MSQQNILAELQSMASYSRLTKAAAATLTSKEVMAYRYVDVTAAVAITLPAASDGNKGAIVTIAAAEAVTVVVTAGFGGAGSGKDTLTLENGEAVTVHSDGSYWFQESNDTAT